MFVSDDRQGHGIGRALMADIVAVSEGLGVERIHVVSHPPAEACAAHGPDHVVPSAAATRHLLTP